MGKSSSQVVGYRYSAKFAAFIGNRIEKFLGINFDNRGWILHDPTKHPPNLLPVQKPNLYGETEGGVSGNIDIHFGTPDQEPNAEYQKYFPLVSGYPYQSYLVFRGEGGPDFSGVGGIYEEVANTLGAGGKSAFYVGNSGYMKEMLLWVKRTRVRNDGRGQWHEVRGDRAVVCEIGGVAYSYNTSETSPFHFEFNAAVYRDGIKRNYGKDEGFYEALTNDKETPAGKTEGVYSRTAFGNYGGSDAVHEATMLISTVPAGMVHRIVIDGEAVGGECRFSSNIQIIEILDRDFSKQKHGNDFFETHKFYLDCIARIEEPINVLIESVGSVKAYSDTNGPLADQMISLVSVKSEIYPGIDSGGAQLVGVDINPIHKIREILTDNTAMGKPESDVNDVNFMKAADRIYDEGLGISWAIDEKSCIEAIEELCYHIEAGIRVNRQTGLYEMVLFRDDWFAEDEIHDISESKIKDLSLEVMNSDDIVNQLNVTYYDRQRIKNSTFSVYENGSILTMGHANAESIDFPYFMNMRNAEIVANWKLKQLSTPAWSGSFTTGWKEARKWNRYDLIRLPWSKKWNGTILVRIIKINLGNGTDNTVTIDFEEVIPYSGEMNTSIVVDAPVESAPQPPQPCQYEPFELPYYLAVMALGQRQVDDELAYESNFGLVGVVAEQPQSNSLYAIMKTHNGVEGEEWLRAASIQYSETADLDQILSKTSSNFTVKNWKKLANVSAGTLIKCGRDWLGTPGEWMVFQGIDPYTGIISVKRGALDTLPQEWGVDSKLYFCGDDIAYDANEYVLGEEILVSALTTTPSGVLEQKGSIPVEIQARAIRPYPPANVKINGAYYSETIVVTNDIVLTWAHRNRVQQTGGEIIGWFDNGVTLENGVTYSLELSTTQDGIVYTVSGVTLDNHAIPSAVLLQNKAHKLKLWSVREGFESYQIFEHNFFVESVSLVLTATASKDKVVGSTVPAANISVDVDGSLKANMKFDGSNISGKAEPGSTITIEIEE